MKKRLLIRSFLIIFFVLANITNLVTLPFTNAKYLKEDNFAYETSMYKANKVYNVTFVSLDTVDDQIFVNYHINFDRIIMNYPGERDKYVFYARVNNSVNTCTLNLDPAFISSTDTGMATLSYSLDNATSSIMITARCNVTGLSGAISIHFYANEQIGNDDSFNLFNYTATYYNYDVYSAIMNELQNGSAYNDYDANLRDIMIGFFRKDIKSLADMYLGYQVDGLTYDLSNGTYHIDDYFIGHAISYSNRVSLNEFYKFAFSSSNNMGAVFKHYLKTYLGYDDEYISVIEQYILDSTSVEGDTLDEALRDIYTNGTYEVIDVYRMNPSGYTIPQVVDIGYDAIFVENIANIKYGLDNKFKIDSSTSLLTSYYNVLIKKFNVDVFNNTGATTITGRIRTAYRDLEDNNAKLYIINSTINEQPVKVLVNIYQRNEDLVRPYFTSNINYNYLSVQVLEEGAEITLNKDTTTILYDETNTEIPTTNTEDIISEIGKFVYGDEYQLPAYVEDGNVVTYTLNN